jgi:hypothetical protein
MKDLRLLTTSAACALGAAMLVTTALQSTPAEARDKAKTNSHAVPTGFHGGKQPTPYPRSLTAANRSPAT